MRVAVLSGGRSSEHDISLASGRSVAAGLAGGGHEVVAIEIGRDGVWRRDGAELAVRPGRGLEGCEVAFPALHGPFGEDGTVQGLLECLGVPYVGAGVLASSVCMDKLVFKDLLAGAGVPQVAYAHADGPDWEPPFALPAFVKPARLGSSVGIAKVTEPGELRPALAEAFRHDPRVIVEAMAGGLEVECSVLGDPEAGEVPVASVPGEIVIEADWYDYEAKYAPGGMRLVAPARIPEAVRDRVRELAVGVFGQTGCAGMARVDFFVDGEEVLVNELNTIPGFTDTSVYARLFEASGVPYPALLDRLLALAVARHERTARYAH